MEVRQDMGDPAALLRGDWEDWPGPSVSDPEQQGIGEAPASEAVDSSHASLSCRWRVSP